MTDTDTWKVQASFKHGAQQQHLLNVRGDHPLDLKSVLDDLSAHDVLETVVSTGSLLSALDTVVNTIGTQPVAQTSLQQLQQAGGQQAAPVMPTQGGPAVPVTQHVCAHGQRVFKQGSGARGPWSAWMCPTSKGDPTKCEPEWM